MERLGELGSRWTSRPGAQGRRPGGVSCEPRQKGRQDKDTQGQGQATRTAVWLELGRGLPSLHCLSQMRRCPDAGPAAVEGALSLSLQRGLAQGGAALPPPQARGLPCSPLPQTHWPSP